MLYRRIIPVQVEVGTTNSPSKIPLRKQEPMVRFSFLTKTKRWVLLEKMTYTLDQLKSALVAALPEKLFRRDNFDSNGNKSDLFWWVNGPFVTFHEWPAIVGMVEDVVVKAGKRLAYLDAICNVISSIGDKWDDPHLAK